MKRALVLVILLAAALTVAPGGASAAPESGRRGYTGWLDGAEYRVEMPEHWNGSLVLYSHPYYVPGIPPGIGLANRTETENWLLDRGYALAASDFTGRYGAVYDQGPRDQLALLDWIEANIGKPARTIALGSSMGAALSVRLAEENPDRIDGVAALCGPLDLGASWNLSLDVTFAIRTLLAPDSDIDLVRPRDPAAAARALQSAVDEALVTPEGRARLALAGAMGNVPSWNSAFRPEPDALADRVRQMAEVAAVHIWGFGPVSRVDLEQRAGGNPSWNTGIDYGRQLAKSEQRDLVREAYRAAGLDVGPDLARLAAAPRVAADPAAVAWMDRNGVPDGITPAPVVTLHNTADAAVAEHERWYSGRVRRYGAPERLRQLYADRATHCAFTPAEEIVTLRVLFERIETGRWPELSPRVLNAQAGRLGGEYGTVYDYPTDSYGPVAPAFTRFSPSQPLRPSS
ncbi:alpha/beta hydrolase family protein [Amycolatopsis lurida]